MQADPGRCKKLGFRNCQVEIGEMPYFETNAALVAYPGLKSNEVGSVTLVYPTILKTKIWAHLARTEMTSDRYLNCFQRDFSYELYLMPWKTLGVTKRPNLR